MHRLDQFDASAGIDFPRLFRYFDMTYEISEWSNIWYVNSTYLAGMSVDHFVLGNWGADQRVFGDGVVYLKPAGDFEYDPQHHHIHLADFERYPALTDAVRSVTIVRARRRTSAQDWLSGRAAPAGMPPTRPAMSGRSPTARACCMTFTTASCNLSITG